MRQHLLFPSAVLAICALTSEERGERDRLIANAARHGHPAPYSLEDEILRWGWRRERGLPNY